MMTNDNDKMILQIIILVIMIMIITIAEIMRRLITISGTREMSAENPLLLSFVSSLPFSFHLPHSRSSASPYS